MSRRRHVPEAWSRNLATKPNDVRQTSRTTSQVPGMAQTDNSSWTGGSRLSACPREIVTVEVKLLVHSFLSLTFNTLFASGSWLCYLFVIAFFLRLLTIVFVDCHVLTFEMTILRWRNPIQFGIHRDYPDEASGCSHGSMCDWAVT